MSSSGAGWRGTGLSDVGRVRSSNQDAFAVLDHSGIWIVADGMGGHAGGNVASRLAVDTIASCSESLLKSREASRPQPEEAFLRQAIDQANQAIRQETLTRPELTGMGTTVVLVQISTHPLPHAIIAHVGDSRAYLIRKQRLAQLTQDHSWVEEQIRHGNLSPQDAERHPMRHVLTRAVGTEASVTADVSTHAVEPGDLILLCTDGLTKMLSDEEILRVLLRTGTSPQNACQLLIEEANQRGGQDNTTVLTIHHE